MTNHPQNCALYLRSSNDLHAVSLDAQRRQLETMAAERGLFIVGEFSDAVESGSDDQRPGFQALLRELKAKDRQWSTLLALDTEDPAPYRRAIAEKERERHECLAERNDASRQADQAKAARAWNASDVRVLLQTLRGEIDEGIEREDVASVRRTLATLIDRVEFEPGADSCRVVYRLDTGNNGALPRGRTVTPVGWDRIASLVIRR